MNEAANRGGLTFSSRKRSSLSPPLPKSKQRTPIAAAAGLVPTHKAAGEAARVPFLQLGVINTFSKIEPDHRAARAMSLRLSFIAKRGQWRRGCIGRAARDDQSGQQIPRAKKNLHGRCYFQFHCEFVLGQTYKSALMASAQPSVVPLTQRGPPAFRWRCTGPIQRPRRRCTPQRLATGDPDA